MSDAGRLAIIQAVRGITPSSEAGSPFTCHQDSTGATVSLDELVMVMRVFDLEQDAGGLVRGDVASADARHWSENWTLRIQYPVRRVQDMERLARQIKADVRDIIDTVEDPAVWLGSLTDLSVGHESVSMEMVVNERGEPVAMRALIPLSVAYYA